MEEKRNLITRIATAVVAGTDTSSYILPWGSVLSRFYVSACGSVLL